MEVENNFQGEAVWVSPETLDVIFKTAKILVETYHNKSGQTGPIDQGRLETALHRVIEVHPREDGEFFFQQLTNQDSAISQAVYLEYSRLLSGEIDPALPALIDVPSARRRPLNYLDLHRDTRYELAVLRLKINDPDEFSCDEDTFYRLFDSLADTEVFTKNSIAINNQQLKERWNALSDHEKKLFQAGLTNFSETPSWKNRAPKNTYQVLIALAELFPQDLDLRVSRQMDETIWYMEKMKISASGRDAVIRTLLSIEPLYRGKERKFQRNKTEPDRRETAFNHFLGVLRTSLGLIDLARKNQDLLPPNAVKFFEHFSSEEARLEICLTAATHDVVEDGVIDSDGLRSLLRKCIPLAKANSPTLDTNLLLNNCLINSFQLDTHNFVEDDGERDYPDYTQKILDSKSPVLILTKIADILVNRRSPLGQAHQTAPHKNKDDSYMNFLHTVTVGKKLLPVIPARFIADMIDYYPSWAEDKRMQACFKIWMPHLNEEQKVKFFESIQTKGISERVAKVLAF